MIVTNDMFLCRHNSTMQSIMLFDINTDRRVSYIIDDQSYTKGIEMMGWLLTMSEINNYHSSNTLYDMIKSVVSIFW